MSLAPVAECSATDCSFNQHGCTADAITVAARHDGASCVTFIGLDQIGGLDRAAAHVGACQRIECAFNDHLMCSSEGITVGKAGDTADCLTFTSR